MNLIDAAGSDDSLPHQVENRDDVEETRRGDSDSTRIAKEISIFEAQDKLHEHVPAMNWRNATYLSPALERTFGYESPHDIYAVSIAESIARSGLGEVVSLGCGNGEQELEVLRRADQLGLTQFRITGLELAPSVAERANAAARSAGMDDRLRVIACDLNQGLPWTRPLAAVMAHHTLHHIVGLEAVFDSVAELLDPDGALITFDMIGRNGHMRWPEVRPLMQELWSCLPIEKRYDHVFQRQMNYFQDWDCAVEGFEGVRAQDILRLLVERFTVSKFYAWGAVSETFLLNRFGPNFDPELDDDRDFLTKVVQLEQTVLERRMTTPTEMGAEFRSSRSSFATTDETKALVSLALRQPNEHFARLDAGQFLSPYPMQPGLPVPTLLTDIDQPFAAGTPAADALREGFEPAEPDGVWAVLDEQRVVFHTSEPVATIELNVWSNLPTHRNQRISAMSDGCSPADSGPLACEEPAVLALSSSEGAKQTWEIVLTCTAYRLPDIEGGVDQRPLAYRLVSAKPMGKQAENGQATFDPNRPVHG